jgi:phospholipid/cholesterol/gamma-HCH transport system ATP-binding protein
MSAPEPVIVSLEGVRKSFATNDVLRGIDLEVRRGETVVVLGGSGSGKSVLLKHINGLLRPDAGRVVVLGCDVAHLSEDDLVPLRRRVSYVFQGGALFDSLDVGENVAFPLREARACGPEEIAATVAGLLARVGLAGSERVMPADLSGGMRKRVALARGLALEPEVILYDEPTAGLDPLTAESIAGLMRTVSADTGATSMVVTHDLLLAWALNARVAFLRGGTFQFLGTLGEAAGQPGWVGQFVRVGGVHAGYGSTS